VFKLVLYSVIVDVVQSRRLDQEKLAQRSATHVMRRPIPYPRRRQATGCCPRGQTGLLKCHRKEGLRSQIDWNSCPFRQILIEI
jgi:hypothetical protein